MYTYTYPLSLATRSLIRILTQAITHTYITLKPQTEREDDVQCFLSRTPCRLRFPIGHRVRCFLGVEEGWKTGTVINHYYREKDWVKGRIAPYQICLDGNDQLVFAPADEDRMIRDEENRIVVPGPAFLIEKKKWLYVSMDHVERSDISKMLRISHEPIGGETETQPETMELLMEIISSYFKERLQVAFHDAKNASLMMEKMLLEEEEKAMKCMCKKKKKKKKRRKKKKKKESIVEEDAKSGDVVVDEVVSVKEGSVEVKTEEKKDEVSSVEVRMKEKKEESSLEVKIEEKEKESSLEVKMDEKKEEPSLEVKEKKEEVKTEAQKRIEELEAEIQRLKAQVAASTSSQTSSTEKNSTSQKGCGLDQEVEAFKGCLDQIWNERPRCKIVPKLSVKDVHSIFCSRRSLNK